MGISQVNQIVKEKPSTFLSPTEFEKKLSDKGFLPIFLASTFKAYKANFQRISRENIFNLFFLLRVKTTVN